MKAFPGTWVAVVSRHALKRPFTSILILVAAQQLFALWSRDIWWSDEVRQADVLRHVLEHGDWLALRLNGVLYPDKPPVYFWLVAGFASLFGSSQPPVIFFALAVTVFLFCAAIYGMALALNPDRRQGLLAVGIVVTSPYLLVLSHYARMDFLFSALIICGWACFYQGGRRARGNFWVVAGFALSAAAVMTKGPFGILLPLAGLVFYLAWQRRLARLAAWDVALGLAILGLTIAAWAIGVAGFEGWSYVGDIFRGQVLHRAFGDQDEFLGPLRYMVTLPVIFLPWTMIALGSDWRAPFRAITWRALARRRGSGDDATVFLWASFLGGFLMLSLVREKHEYYLVPLLCPLAILCARRLLCLSPAAIARCWRVIAVVLAVVAALGLTFVCLENPYGTPIFGLAFSGVLIFATAACVYLLRHNGIAASFLTLILGLTLWINLVTLDVMPSLDPVFSPKQIADRLIRFSDQGYATGVYSMTPGMFGYHLHRTYFDSDDGANAARWLDAHAKAVLVMPLDSWTMDFKGHSDLNASERLMLAGDTIVIVVKTSVPKAPLPGTDPASDGSQK